jgi:hypothetical protein
MDYIPYVSVDLETTGLPEEEAQILQISLVVEGCRNVPVNSLSHATFFIDNGAILTGNHYALSLNKWILDEILKHRQKKPTMHPVLTISEAQEMFKNSVKGVLDSINIERKEKKLKSLTRLQMAGKNVAGFDIPMLKGNGFDVSLFTHRVIDPGPMFFHIFGYVPSLDEIKQKYSDRFDVAGVTHDAYQDALDVVTSIRIAKEIL